MINASDLIIIPIWKKKKKIKTLKNLKNSNLSFIQLHVIFKEVLK